MKCSAKLVLLSCLWGMGAVCFFSPLPSFAQGDKETTPAAVTENPASTIIPAPTATPPLNGEATAKPAEQTGVQTGVQDNTPAGTTDETVADGNGEGKSEEVKKTLYLETLFQDINTANYYELVDWCQRLGLSDAGEPRDLKQRLYTFFNIVPLPTSTPPPTPQTTGEDKPKDTKEQPSNAGKLIHIRSAKSTEYFEIEEINEEYLVLQGDVVIEFQDTAEGSTHLISAQRVMVNQTQKLLTAVGDIRYSLTKTEEEPEVFTGESFIFNIESWAGGFIDARGEKNSEVADDKTVKFFYQGENLSRLKNDIIILQKGTISSCEDTEDPHWSIKAQKIWVLAPGEWAVRDAILHVGRVPVFYLPFFFKPGDDFFFHPVLGYRDREGFFIQTTTYLIGQKKEKDSAFSFLRASEDKKKEYELELNGLFLKKGKKIDKKSEQERVLKVIADFYTRLGGFTGLVLDFSPVWRLRGGLGFSRNLYPSGTSYTPYKDNNLASDWNTTPLWDIDLPFRFGFDTNFNFKTADSTLTMSGDLQLYSDPFFEEDFYHREEEIDWFKMIKGEDSSTASTTATNAQSSTGAVYDLIAATQKPNFYWTFKSSIGLPALPPYLNSVRLNNLNLSWEWISQDNKDVPADSVDPSRKFYVPSKLRFPENANLQISGTLLNWSSQSPPAPRKPPAGEPTDVKAGNDFGKGFSFPASSQSGENVQASGLEQTSGQAADSTSASAEAVNDKTGMTQETKASFLEPDALDDLTVELDRSLLSTLNITYSLTPALTLENQFATDKWTTPEQVNFSSNYIDLIHNGSFYLNYKYSLWGALISGDGQFYLLEQYRDRLHNAVDGWSEVRDQENSHLGLHSVANINVQPLLDVKYFSTSFLKYSLNWNFYKYFYQAQVGDFVHDSWLWDKTYVKSHSVAATLNFKPDSDTHSLTLSANLPPLDGDYRGKLNFILRSMDLFSLNTYIETGYRETASGWEFTPLTVVETLTLGSLLGLTETLLWDLNTQDFTEARTQAKFCFLPFWNKYLLESELILKPNEPEVLNLFTSTLNIQNFRTTFKAQAMEPKVLDLVVGKWVTGSTEKAFLPQSLKFEYSQDFKDLKFWKNRITSSINVNTYWELALQEFTNSAFRFTLTWDFKLHEFLDFKFILASHNSRTYLYFPAWAEQLGDTWTNPLIDLLKSFNVFYRPHRESSNFKMDYVSIVLTHRLHDWDLKLNYIGKQELVPRAGGGEEYQWMPEFEISLEWNPIPELVHKVKQNDGVLNVKG